MSNTKHNNFAILPTGPVDWIAAINDFMNKVEAGRTLKCVAGENLLRYDPVRLVGVFSGEALKADNTVEVDGIWQSESTSYGDYGYMQIGGVLTKSGESWTVGGRMYASASKTLVQSPSTSYPIGKAISANEMIVVPYMRT